MKTLFIINDPPYGTERFYNAMRLASNLLKVDDANEVAVFLVADAVVGARKGQKTPDGYYNLERVLKVLMHSDAEILLCGSCMDARGITDDDVIEGARRVSMEEVAERTMAADKVLVF